MITKTQYLKDTCRAISESRLGKEFCTGATQSGDTLNVFVDSKNFRHIMLKCIYENGHYELQCRIGGYPSLKVMTTQQGKYDLECMLDFLYELCSQKKISFYFSLYRYLRKNAYMGVFEALKEAKVRVIEYSKK